MSIYSPTPLGAPPSDAVDRSARDVEASDGMLQTRPDTQPSVSQMDDGASDRPENAVDEIDVPTVVPVQAEQVSCTTNDSTCLHLYC